MASNATVGILRVLLSADSAEFQSDLKKAASATQLFSKEVKVAGASAEAVSAAMTKGFASAEQGTKGLGKAIAGLVGFDAIEKANTYAKAVEAIGGASKLTATEQAKVNAIVGEATAKYAALGREAPSALTALANATKPVQEQTSKLSGYMGDLATQVKATALGFISAQAVIGTVSAAFHALVGFVEESVKAYSEQESAVKKMTTALRTQGTATPEVIGQYKALSTQFQKTTVNSDELINEMQALLVQVGNVMPSQMDKALTAATDLASGLGIDLRTATMLVGKAFEGETGTLKRYGIVIDEAKLKTEGVTAVMDAIQSKFGGQAQAEVETYAGKVKQLSNAWNELQESVGRVIVEDPSLQFLLREGVQVLTKSADAVEAHQNSWSAWAAASGGWISVLGALKEKLDDIAIASNNAARATLEGAAAYKKAISQMAGMTLENRPNQFGSDLIDIDAVKKQWDKEEKELDALRKRIEGIRDALFGTGAIKQAQDYIKAIGPLPNIAKMTREQQDKVNDVMGAAILAYKTLGQVAPKAVVDTYTATFNLDRLLDKIEPRLSEGLPSGLQGIGQAIEHEVIPPFIHLATVIDGLPPGFEHVGRIAIPTFKEVRQQTRSFGDELNDLSRAFSELAQVSGGSLSGIAGWIGELVGALNLADKASKQLSSSLAMIAGSLKGAGTDWKSLGTGLMGAASAIAAGAAAVASATDPSHKTTEQTTVGGAAAGAKVGMAFGPYGALVGAGVGALVGWWRGAHAEWKKVADDIGHDIGQDISDGLAQQIAQLDKTLVGGTKAQRRKWAEALSLDAIIQEAGGLKSSNIDKFTKQAANLFEVIKRGGEQGAQATQVLNGLIGQFAGYAQKTGGLWSQTFKDLIAQSKALGLNLEAVTAAVEQQITTLASGLSAAIAGAFPKEGIKLDDLGLADAQAAFDRLSRTALASFNAIIASGKSAFEAISLLGPAIDQLIAEHDRLGLAGGAAFDQLARFRVLTSQNAELMASVGGLNDVLSALANLGGLTADALADLEAQGLDAFQKLTAAGFTENEALQQMVPFLQNVLKAHKDLKIPIDANTQALIDQATAQGLLSDEAMSTNDILMEGFKALIEAVGGTLPDAFKKMGKAAKDAAKEATDGINKIPKTVDIEVNYHPGDSKPEPAPYTPPPLEPGDTGRRFASGGVVPEMAAVGGLIHPQYAATGKRIARILSFTPKGTDTVPAMLTPGEGVLNTRAMQMVGSDGLAALNQGWSASTLASSYQPQTLQKTGTDGGGPSEVYVDVTVTGEIISSRDRAIDIGKSIAVELRRNGDLRDVWETPIKGLSKRGL